MNDDDNDYLFCVLIWVNLSSVSRPLWENVQCHCRPFDSQTRCENALACCRFKLTTQSKCIHWNYIMIKGSRFLPTIFARRCTINMDHVCFCRYLPYNILKLERQIEKVKFALNQLCKYIYSSCHCYHSSSLAAVAAAALSRRHCYHEKTSKTSACARTVPGCRCSIAWSCLLI